VKSSESERHRKYSSSLIQTLGRILNGSGKSCVLEIDEGIATVGDEFPSSFKTILYHAPISYARVATFVVSEHFALAP
jgi:hypothetical protein